MKTVLVAGDVCIDVIGVPKQRPGARGDDEENWRLTGEIRTHYLRGGALLLADMVKAAVSSPNSVRGPILATPKALSCGKAAVPLDSGSFPRLTHDEIVHSLITADMFKTSAKADKDDKTLRVARTHGFSGPTQGNPLLTPKPPTGKKGSLLVLDDTGNRFRRDESQWRRLVTADPALIVLKLHRPLPLAEQSAKSVPNTLWDTLTEEHPDRTLVVVSADDLRVAGAVISRQLSWERTARELLWHLISSPEFKPLANCRWLVVRFGLDGALCWHQPKAEKHAPPARAWLVYDPSGVENQFASSFQGQMVGYASAFTAALVGTLVSDCKLPTRSRVLPRTLSKGIKRGLQAVRQLLVLGYGNAPESPSYPTARAFKEREKAEKVFRCIAVPLPSQRSLADPVGDWTMLRDLLPGGNELYEAAASLVIHKTPPVSLEAVPRGTFGALSTYDRGEAEGYRAISNLMQEYLAMPSPKRPLCFAVFGPPGAGKSFGVQQVANSVAGDVFKLEKLVFNLSQFRTPDELAPALHLVRDAVVKGRVPLVFFDEFDASVGSARLFWLKYLLAPMQDGEFMDQGVAHPIGKAIFVFAGGTSNSYADFIFPAKEVSALEPVNNPQTTSEDYFRAAKGKDFVSRLRGFLNIQGVDHGDGYRGPALLRRASVLRFQLSEKAPHLLDASGTLHIDPGVLRAFLQVRTYEHGIRSLEALLDMSMLAGRDNYEPGCLPSPAQLGLHVSPKQTNDQPGMGFLDLVYAESPWPSSKIRDRIAEEIHKLYLEERKGPDGGYDPKKASHQEWKDLSEFYRDSNRAQADDIPRKLRLLDLDCCSKNTVGDRTIVTEQEFNDEGNQELQGRVDKAAKAEHDRWWSERRRQGWVYGEKEDPVARTHPDMREWEELRQRSKDKDLNTIRAIPRYLKVVGFVVFNPSPSKPKAK